MVSERTIRRIERLLDEAEESVSKLDWETVRAADSRAMRLIVLGDTPACSAIWRIVTPARLST